MPQPLLMALGIDAAQFGIHRDLVELASSGIIGWSFSGCSLAFRWRPSPS
jgi:hypothetical protein